MKMTLKQLLVFVAAFAGSAAFAAEGFSPITGEFQPEQSAGCADQFTESLVRLKIVATSEGVESIQGPYTFSVGTVTEQATGFFNEFNLELQSGYLNNGSAFRAVKYVIDKLNPTPVYAGEVDILVEGNQMEIRNSFSQPGTMTTPSPVSVCNLVRVN